MIRESDNEPASPVFFSSAGAAAAASAIRSWVMLLLLATCLLVSVEALWVGAIDVTARAMRSVSCGDEGLNANDGVAARTKARAAAEILEGLMALLGSGRGMASIAPALQG